MALGHGRAPIRGKQRKGGEGVRERGESFCSAAPQPLLPCTPWKKSSVRKNGLKPQKVDLEKVGGGGGGEKYQPPPLARLWLVVDLDAFIISCSYTKIPTACRETAGFGA